MFGVGLTWGLVVELSSGKLKPYHEYFYFVGYAVLTLFRLRWHSIKNKGAVKARQRPLPDWCLVALSILIGLPLNWECAFLWFSRRYAFFSGPVVSLTLLIVALSAAIGLLVRLTGGNWRTALQVFAVASCVPSAIALGLGFLR
jgi:hypothetical protein